MLDAPSIVSRLLEADDDLADAKRFLSDLDAQAQQRRSASRITPENAMTLNRFYHRTRRYARGSGPYEARRNGRTQTWKTRPGEFRIPIKIGFKGHGYIDHTNAHEWSATPDVDV